MEDRLQKFARLVELGSFTKTAESLHISQPALSLAINKLEHELQAALLIRTNRTIELTAAGRIVYAAAIEHRIISENMNTKLLEQNHQRLNVAIGMIDSVAAALSETSQSLDRLEEEVNLSIVVNNSRYLREAVKNLEATLAIVVEDPQKYPALDTIPFGVEPFMVLCHPKRLARAEAEIEKGGLSQFICYDRLSVTYRLIDEKLRSLGVHVQPTFYSTSPEVMKRMVLSGKYVAALPYLLTQELLANRNLVPLTKNGKIIIIERPIAIVKVRGKILPAQLEVFLARARETLNSIRQDSKKTS